MIKHLIPSYLVLAALAFGCSEAEKINPLEKTTTKMIQQDRSSEPLVPSPYALRFCQNLADVVEAKDEVMDSIGDFLRIEEESCYVQRTAKFVIPVNQYFHRAGTVSCRYQDPCDEVIFEENDIVTRARRDLISSIRIEYDDVGNPDHEYHQFFDDHRQDSAGNPLKDEEGNALLGADGILDNEFGGTLYGGRWWTPNDSLNIFPALHKDYSQLVKTLWDQLQAGILVPVNQLNQRLYEE